jgi:hypothetical protein
MSFSKFFAHLKRYDENAAVIFDQAEPVGQATDLVMPRRHWFRRAVVVGGGDPGRVAFSQEDPRSKPRNGNS